MGCIESNQTNKQQVFDSLRQAKLTLQSKKCNFGVERVKYLGHTITKEGVELDPENTEKERTFPKPKSQKDGRLFLILCNYHRWFVENFTKIATPLNAQLAKEAKFNWNAKCKKSFTELKEALVRAPVLKLYQNMNEPFILSTDASGTALVFHRTEGSIGTAPVLKYPNMNEPCILSTDASGTAIGYMLGQKYSQGREMVVAYGGRSLRPDECKYTVSEQECLAVMEGIKAYSVCLSRKSTVYTDHQDLKCLHSIRDPRSR